MTDAQTALLLDLLCERLEAVNVEIEKEVPEEFFSTRTYAMAGNVSTCDLLEPLREEIDSLREQASLLRKGA